MSTVNVTNSMTVASVNVDTTNQTVIGVNSSQNVATVNVEATNDVTVQISRTAIGTVANVLTSNYANYAGNVVNSAQPNITSVGTLTNLSVSGNVTAGNVHSSTVYDQGMQVQGYDYVQMQFSNSVNLPVSPYDIGTGSWFYLDPGGAIWQSNTTGTLKTVILGNDGTVSANGNISTNNNVTALKFYAGTGSDETHGYGFTGEDNADTAICLSDTDEITIYNNAIETLRLYANNNSEFYGNLKVDGSSDLGNVSNVIITGGTNGYVLQTDGSGNLSWTEQTGGGGNTGNVTFDNQIVIGTGDISGGSGLYLAPGSNSLANLQYLRVRGGDYITHIHFDTGNNQFYDQYFGDDNKYVKLEANGNIVINSNDYIGNSQQWDFGIDGNLTLPSNTSSINYANGSPYGGGLGNLIVYGRTGGISISTVGGFINVVGRTGNIYVYL